MLKDKIITKHVILVDDKGSILETLEDLLSGFCIQQEIQIHSFSNPRKAFAKVQILKADSENSILVVTDLQFPQEDDGLDLIQIIIKQFNEQRPFIVLFTEKKDLSDKRVKKAWDLADEVITKPRGIFEIKKILGNYFDCPFEKVGKILPTYGRMQ
ncbi:response regulator [bacterium]|nr:MAG: response regulator [bacterium]